MSKLVRFMLSGIIVPLSLLLATALCTGAVAQTTKHKIPTASQAAMKKKPDFKGHQGVMRGTTNTDRWQAAINKANVRPAHTRPGNRGGNKYSTPTTPPL